MPQHAHFDRIEQSSQFSWLQHDYDSDDWESEPDCTNDNSSANTYALQTLDGLPQSLPKIHDQASVDFRIEKSNRLDRRHSDATEQSFMLYTPDEEQSVVKKLDIRLVLFIALLYMLSFLDRSSNVFAFTFLNQAVD